MFTLTIQPQQAEIIRVALEAHVQQAMALHASLGQQIQAQNVPDSAQSGDKTA
jgi:hypothetical protein